MSRDFPPPPSNVTGELGAYLNTIYQALSKLPNVSYFSGTTPNSTVTGVAGDMLINLGSGSTDTRAWIKGGSPTSPSRTGWVTLHTGPA